jgi:hypothetical protein
LLRRNEILAAMARHTRQDWQGAEQSPLTIGPANLRSVLMLVEGVPRQLTVFQPEFRKQIQHLNIFGQSSCEPN